MKARGGGEHCKINSTEAEWKKLWTKLGFKVLHREKMHHKHLSDRMTNKSEPDGKEFLSIKTVDTR